MRAKHNRCLPNGDGDDDGDKLWTHTSAGAALGEITFTMAARDKQTARIVRQQLWTRSVEISDGKAGRITATCVVARKIGAPKGVKPIEWRLLTNRSELTREQAVELIDWYRARREIEIYFHVLKNGCEAESLQLSAIDRAERPLALFVVAAWRVTNLMPNGPVRTWTPGCSSPPDEIRGRPSTDQKKMPTKPPTLTEVVLPSRGWAASSADRATAILAQKQYGAGSIKPTPPPPPPGHYVHCAMGLAD